MPNNPSPPFSGRSWELPACLHASALSTCPKALAKNCTLFLKSSHIQNKMKFSAALSQQEREIALCHPAFLSSTKGAFCSLPFTYSFRMGKKKKLPFLSWEALLQQHLDIHCLQENASKRRMELHLRHASSWKLSSILLLFLNPKFRNLVEKKCFSSVITSLMQNDTAHTES